MSVVYKRYKVSYFDRGKKCTVYFSCPASQRIKTYKDLVHTNIPVWAKIESLEEVRTFCQ